MTMRDLTGDAAVVTGASSGIGRETARALAAAGADVALAARRADRLEALAEELRDEHGREALAVPTDVTDEAAVGALVERTVDAFGGLDVAVANAGLVAGAGVEGLASEDYHRMTDVNVNGAFYTARAALPHLRASSGHLLFTGSFAGQYPRPYNPVYAATKWWVRGFALSLSAAVGDDDVAVTVVHPSEVRTPIEVAGERFDERFEPGEVLEPESVAEAIVFAARQDDGMVSELSLNRRDKFVGF